MNIRGFVGWIDLTDRMGKNIRKELGLDDNATSFVLTTFEATIRISDGVTTSVKFSPLEAAPIIARTKARRERYGVYCKM